MNLATALQDLGAARDHLPEHALHWLRALQEIVENASADGEARPVRSPPWPMPPPAA